MDLYFDIHFGILYNKSIVFPRNPISFRKDRHFAIGEVERMAKEAMQAVSRAEQAALETVQQAKEEADRLRREGIIISHRKWIEITDFPRLAACCSSETLKS